MRRVGALLALLALVGVVGCGGRAAGRAPLIVDTDLSSDDIIALAYLSQDPKVELAAVTVSGTGLVECPQGAQNVAALLAALGRADVPVACGRQAPRSGGNALPAEWRRAADAMFGLTLPAATHKPGADASRLLAQTIASSPRAPTVLELAPMTNLAQAFDEHPNLAKRIARVVAMGGAFSVPGNTPDDRTAEVNIWADPAAARAVVGSGAALTLVPLDATNDVPVTTYIGAALKRFHHEAPAATIAWDLVLATSMDHGGQYFWDPLAAVAVTHPDLVSTRVRSVAVSTTGRTTIDAAGVRVRVATHAGRAAFEHELISTLLGGRPFTLPPERPNATVTFTSSGCSYAGARSVVSGTVVLDSVNRSPVTFQWIAGHLDARHTLGELRAYAARLRSANAEPPAWFTVDAAGETPPRSTMTWVVYVPLTTTGSAVIACATRSQPSASVVASISVFGQG